MGLAKTRGDGLGFASVRRIVVKLGSAVIAPGGRLDEEAIVRLAGDMATSDREVVVVSSGAVASGFRALGLEAMPRSIVQKQAAAAVGQQRLMAAWAGAFQKHGRVVAQVLLTADDLDDRARHLNARRTLEALLAAGVIPIINENDSVSYAEIKLGDNDRLSALVAGLVGADLLVILSSIDGVYEQGDGKRVIAWIENIGAARRHIRAGTSEVGTGGMATKLDAAEIAVEAGAHVVIARGAQDRVLARILGGEALGTHFPAAGRGVGARRRWIGRSTRVRGTIVVDEGCGSALTERGASLLPSGVVGVEGEFGEGACVAVRYKDGRVLARGLTSYSSGEIRRLRGKKSADIERTLGYCYREEIIHRDDLVLTAGSKGERS